MSKLGGKSKSDKRSINQQNDQITLNRTAKGYKKFYEENKETFKKKFKEELKKPIGNNEEDEKEEDEKDKGESSGSNNINIREEGEDEGGNNDLGFIYDNDINNKQEENNEDNLNDINNINNNEINENINTNNIHNEIIEEEEEKTNSIHNSVNNSINNNIQNSINNSTHNSTNVLNNNNEQNNNNNIINNNYTNFVYDYRQQLFQAQRNFFEMGVVYYNNNYNNINITNNNNNNQTAQEKLNEMESWDLQDKYEKGNNYVQHLIFEYLRGSFLKRALDKHQNYLVKLIIDTEGKRCYQKIKIISDELKKNYLNLSLNKFGTYVLQKLITFLDKDELHDLNEELINDNHFEILINDKNGNHVLQILIACLFDINDIKKLFEKIKTNAINYCKTKYGSFVVQGLLAKMSINYIINLISEFKNDNLLNNEFGIHIVQKILERYNYSFNINFIYKYLEEINIYDKIIDKPKEIKSSFCNIIECILEKGRIEEKEKMIDKLMKERNKFILLFSDIHGNHVVQKVYQVANQEIKNTIKNMLNEVQNRNMYFGFVKTNISKYKYK